VEAVAFCKGIGYQAGGKTSQQNSADAPMQDGKGNYIQSV